MVPMISCANPSSSPANSPSRLTNRLYAITDGTATASPATVVTSASATPGATAAMLPEPPRAMPMKASITPSTVPSRPSSGLTEPKVASQDPTRIASTNFVSRLEVSPSSQGVVGTARPICRNTASVLRDGSQRGAQPVGERGTRPPSQLAPRLLHGHGAAPQLARPLRRVAHVGAPAGRRGQQLRDPIDRRLDARADVPGAGVETREGGQHPLARRQIRGGHVLHVHHVARLLAVAEHGERLARQDLARENRHDPGLPGGVLARAVHVAAAQGRRLDAVQ